MINIKLPGLRQDPAYCVKSHRLMLGETDISLHAMNRVFSALPSLGVGGCRAKGRECNGDTEGKGMFLLLLKKKKKKKGES